MTMSATIITAHLYLESNTTTTEFISIYTPLQTVLNTEIIELITTENTTICGDMNAKHRKWGCKNTSKSGKTLYEGLLRMNLEITTCHPIT